VEHWFLLSLGGMVISASLFVAALLMGGRRSRRSAARW
jgi:hypothetical protein